jgi:hypothetical protein
MIGGCSATSLDDVHVLNATSLQWSKIDTPGFAGRYGHSAYQFKGKIYIFGGMGGFNKVTANRGNITSLMAFDLKSRTWEPCHIQPSPRRNHGMTGVKHLMMLHGGVNADNHLTSDLLLVDLKKHT